MPLAGLSLLAFMNDEQATAFLVKLCKIPDTSPPALEEHRSQAKKRIPPPIAKAGKPEIRTLDPKHDAHLRRVKKHPRFALTTSDAKSWSFALVEIAPILAWQFQVATPRSYEHCGALKSPPSVEQMLPITLPIVAEPISPSTQMSVGPGGNGLLVRADGLNLRLLQAGRFGNAQDKEMTVVGVGLGTGSNLVQVVRFGDRCFLRNGYHRAFGLMNAGATHMPCLLLEAQSWETVGAPGGISTFERAQLEAADAPTLGHFAQTVAYPVSLRLAQRLVHVQWTEHIALEP